MQYVKRKSSGEKGYLRRKAVQLFEVIKRPLVTEKNTTLQGQGKYSFEVDSDANKMQVKQAVEKAFKVTVVAVNVMTVRGRERRVGRRKVLAGTWKKAVVSLKPGDKIQILKACKEEKDSYTFREGERIFSTIGN
jgi:large subunit ribosomal protein L23